MSASQPTQQDAKEKFVAVNGYWTDAWDKVLGSAPDFFADCVDLMAAPGKIGRLDAKVTALIHIAVNVACTHLNEAETRLHIRRALALGVRAEEIGEAIQLVSVLGIHSCNIGVPMMVEEARAAGVVGELGNGEFDAPRQALKEAFIRQRGYWSPLWDDVLRLSPEFFESYTRFSTAPLRSDALSPKLRELIYIAIDIATQHLFEPGTRVHLINALKHGASVLEILQVIETVSLIGLQSVSTGYAILAEELAARD